MEHISKTGIMAGIGAAGAVIAHWLGGWDAALSTLVIFMAIDFGMGLIIAGFFKKSSKSKTGALDSRAGWAGLLRKGITLAIVFVACQLDKVIGSDFIRDATVIAFVVNETLSIVENAGLMGVPIPAVITNAIEILKKKSEGPEKGVENE